jgi:hypothetical protein
VQYVNCDGLNAVIGEFDPVSYTFPRDAGIFICARDFLIPERIPGFAYIYIGCYCCESCQSYSIFNSGAEDIAFTGERLCGGGTTTLEFLAGQTYEYCMSSVISYFDVSLGIDYVENLIFTPIECNCG